jgi:hypothetical protein
MLTTEKPLLFRRRNAKLVTLWLILAILSIVARAVVLGCWAFYAIEAGIVYWGVVAAHVVALGTTSQLPSKYMYPVARFTNGMITLDKIGN